MQQLVKEYPNLVQYVDRIREQYYGDELAHRHAKA